MVAQISPWEGAIFWGKGRGGPLKNIGTTVIVVVVAASVAPYVDNMCIVCGI